MTQLQKKAYEVLNYLLHKPHNTNVIRIGIEEAKSLKRLIDNQEGFIKELQQDIADLRLENAELEKEYYEMVDKVIHFNSNQNVQNEKMIIYMKG